MREFQLIKIKANTPYEGGVQYGKQACQKIIAGIEDYRRLFSETSSMTWEEIKCSALNYVPIIEQLYPEIMEEIKGISVGAEVSIGDIMVLNTRYEITKFPKPNECTSFAILPKASKNNKTYVGQNWDYRVGIMDNIVIIHMEDSNGTHILGLAEAGQVIRNGFNNHGIGLCANNLQSIYDTIGLGIPVTILRRKVLSCNNFEEAKKLLIEAKRTVSCNFMLASSEGKALDLEAYPNGVDIIEPNDDIITHANHFVVEPSIHALEFSPRDERLCELFAENHGSIDVDYIKKCLSDHKNYPKAICRHPSDVELRLGRRSITVASVIYDFTNSSAYICVGPPCEGEFIKYQL